MVAKQTEEKRDLLAALEEFLAEASPRGLRAGGPLEAGFAEIEVSFDGGKTRRNLGVHWIEPVARPDPNEDER